MVDPFQERLAARQSSFKEVVVHQSWLQAPRPLPLVIAKFTVDFFLRGVPSITRCRHGREADGDERRLVDADLRSCVHVPTLCRIRGAAGRRLHVRLKRATNNIRHPCIQTFITYISTYLQASNKEATSLTG